MAYQLVPQTGDSIPVPQLVLKNLNNGKEDYFRVALYVLSTGDTDEESIVQALHLKNSTVAARALAFWQGAGLLQEETAKGTPAVQLKEHAPKLTTREVLLHSGRNPEIAVLMQEAQMIFGEVISENSCNTLASMYVNGKMPLEYLLMGLTHFASQGFTSKKLGIIQRRMEGWQEEGVCTAEELEAYLKLLAQRKEHYAEVAQLMGCDAGSLTGAEQAKINLWYEQYSYTEPMISLAFSMVGSSEKKTVAYLNGILKKWNGKGYRQPRDVMSQGQGSNAMPVGRVVPAEDVLKKNLGKVPKFQLEDD